MTNRDPSLDLGDCWHCEDCGKAYQVGAPGSTTTLDGSPICPACTARFVADFRACRHVWECLPNAEDGEPGHYCGRCGGWVTEAEHAELAQAAARAG